MASKLPEVDALLTAAVSGIGGARRPGQVTMAGAVQHAMESGQHLAVQAGTGTGKSLAYLVPSVRRALAGDGPVIVSTATIALQRQLIERDLPRLAAALKRQLGRKPKFAILKGRRNYACLLKVHGDAPEEPADMLFDPRSASAAGRQVLRLHEWAATTDAGDRDELVPGVDDRAWRQEEVFADLGADYFTNRQDKSTRPSAWSDSWRNSATPSRSPPPHSTSRTLRPGLRPGQLPRARDAARLLLTLLYQRQVCSMNVLADLLEATATCIGDLVRETCENLEDDGHDPEAASVRFTTRDALLAFADSDLRPAQTTVIDRLSHPALTELTQRELHDLTSREYFREKAAADRGR